MDELLGIDKLRITEKIEQYKKKSYELRHYGNAHDNFCLLYTSKMLMEKDRRNQNPDRNNIILDKNN